MGAPIYSKGALSYKYQNRFSENHRDIAVLWHCFLGSLSFLLILHYQVPSSVSESFGGSAHWYYSENLQNLPPLRVLPSEDPSADE
jgi:Na+-transporting NADH:ubiquinone oxidoreductase subunit NqrB